MTRLGQAGFETGDVQQIGVDSVGLTSGTVTIVSATPTPRSGTYCLKCALPSVGSGTWTPYLAKKTFFHASKTEMWYAFAIYPHHISEAPTGSCIIFVAHDTSANVNIVLTLDGGIIRAYYATAGSGAPSFAQCTLIGTASVAISNDAWHLVEIRIVAATGSTGNFELYLDGVSAISASSQRTCQTNANLGNFALIIGGLQTITSIGAGSYHAFDDVRWQDTAGSVNNARPGDEKIQLMVPTSAGDSTQWTPSAGSNYACVDDIPPNGTTDYVSDSTSGHLDLYNTTDFPVVTISAVNIVAQAQNPDGGGGSIYLPTKTAAGQSDGTAQPLTASWAYVNRLLELDPADAAAWTSAKLAALQIGVKVV